MSKNTGLDMQGSQWHPFNSQKVLCHSKRMDAIVNERYLPPIVLNLDVTGKCHYWCEHCHHRRKQTLDKRMPDLSERLAKTLPDFLQHWSEDSERVMACCIVGSQGDALNYPGLPKLLQALHKVDVEVGLVTTGFDFDEELLHYAAFYTKFIGFSVDAGTKTTYEKIKHTPPHAWETVCSNIAQLTMIHEKFHLRNDIGWKILILPDSFKEVYASCLLAKQLGVRYVQIRPADLPPKELAKIDIDAVNLQIRRAIDDLEEPGKFEIVGVRHKFSPTYEKVLPKYCHLTPLTVTVTSDGKAYACVDRRCDEFTMIADCGEYGWSALRDAWGKKEHVQIVHNMINCGGDGPDCNIRCSNYGYDKFFENYFVSDNVDWRLI